jgi:hypothetical protein
MGDRAQGWSVRTGAVTWTSNVRRPGANVGGAPVAARGPGGTRRGLLAASGLGGGAAAEQRKKKRKNRPRPRPCEQNSDCGECGECAGGFCAPVPAFCSNCLTCNPRTLTCGGGCERGKVCCAGECKKPGRDTCCTNDGQCGECWRCSGIGLCEPNPNPIECGNCKRCKDGACAEPDDDLLCGDVCCPDDKVCVGLVFKECCPVSRACANDCCADGEKCTQEDGCCPRGRQCGAGPGGQFPFKSCCGRGETCVDGECCPEEQACGGTCCGGDKVCNRRTGTCCLPCADGRCCPGDAVCIDDGSGGADKRCCAAPNFGCGENDDGSFRDCCLPGIEACIDGECKSCPDGRPLCGRECCPSGQTCRNGQCQPDSTCADGRPPCNGVCCSSLRTCVAGVCCSNNKVCGDTCCSGVQGCCQETMTCGPSSQPCCPADKICGGGSRCCTGRLICCNDTCVDPEFDENNCGGCGVTCQPRVEALRQRPVRRDLLLQRAGLAEPVRRRHPPLVLPRRVNAMLLRVGATALLLSAGAAGPGSMA